MKDNNSPLTKLMQDAQLSRRGFITSVSAVGITSAMGFSPFSAFAAEPKKGGILKLGMSGGNTSDTLDPTLFSDWVPLNQAYMLMNGLIEIDENNKATPELFSAWEAKPVPPSGCLPFVMASPSIMVKNWMQMTFFIPSTCIAATNPKAPSKLNWPRLPV